MLLLITIVDYFKKIVVQYKLDKDKVPPYYDLDKLDWYKL